LANILTRLFYLTLVVKVLNFIITEGLLWHPVYALSFSLIFIRIIFYPPLQLALNLQSSISPLKLTRLSHSLLYPT